MIVFDLACANGHVFEAWFGGAADYDDQRARGLVSCPVCGDGAVEKAPMAPRVPAKANAAPDPKAMLRALAAAQAKVLEGSEHVGTRFAAEARAIHDGEAAPRSIHGQATVAEARRLVEDGVAVAPLPLPVRTPEREH